MPTDYKGYASNKDALFNHFNTIFIAQYKYVGTSFSEQTISDNTNNGIYLSF